MPPDSPNPSQEVETWTIRCRQIWGPDTDRVKVMRVEDHQRLLRAEEEKREAGQFTAAELDALIEALDQHHPGSVPGCPGCELMARLRQMREAANG